MSTSLEKAIHWVYRSRKYFSPFYADNDAMGAKMFSELQLTLFLLNVNRHKLSDKAISEVEKLSELSYEIISSPKYYELIFSCLSFFRLYGAGAIYYLGYAYDEVLFKTVKKATPFVRYNIKELQNYSRMDLEHLLMMFDSYVDGKVKYDSTQLLQNSIIDSDLDIAFYSRLDEYSLTHSIFYVTDFGNNNIPVAVYKRIVYILQTMAYKNYFMNDLDLLGEYIMCLCFMHCGNGCLKELYAGLVSCQNRDGSFSGPSRDGLRKNSKGLKGLYKRQKKIVLDNYHTTLVAIMAMVLYKED